MKSRKAEIGSRVHAIPTVEFEEGRRQLTPFSGLVLFQALFQALGLAARMRRCFAHLDRERVFGLARVCLQLIVHVLLGFRRLRDRDIYADDPLVRRVLRVRRVPDVATISRTLSSGDARSVDKLRELKRELVLERMEAEALPRVTADFDGSALTTSRKAEGTAVGFNKKRKGARSYYPLFCVVAQLGMFFDMLHRPGNVHDSRGAKAFIRECIGAIRARLPRAVIECRLDSAFFHQDILQALEQLGVEYAAAVPYLGHTTLRHLVDSRQRWRVIDREWSFFEHSWRPKSWSSRRRLIVVRHRRARRRKGPLQLDLFEPVEHEFDYKVIVTNKTLSAAAVIKFFNGRGLQEKTYGEAKQFASMEYIPCKRRVANQLYLVCCMLAHNVSRELQLRAAPVRRPTTPTRSSIFELETLGTIRDRLLRRAGRLTNPRRELTLTIGASGAAREEFEHLLEHLQAA